MTNVQSKFMQSVACTCKEFQHPWTDHCMTATAGLLLTSIPYCLRVYSAVYAISLVMRHRIPTLEDLKRTVLGILQSTGFLVTNAFTFIMYNCMLRNLIGRYYWYTIAFIPTFLASVTAIVLERQPRRPLLTLYVANVATETLWNMAEARGWVRSIPQGQTLLFGASASILLYLYRLGLHKTTCKDSLFNILRIFVGKTEEGPLKSVDAAVDQQQGNQSVNGSGFLYNYLRLINGRHATCGHKEPCLRYSVLGGLKPFVGGVGLQVALKLLMNIKKIVQMRMDWRKNIFNGNTLKLGAFLGSFSLLYKSVSCILRHSFNRDDPRFAIPAGLIASIAFTQYPDVTVALYVMWKMLQIVYNLGIDHGIVPKVPGFTIFLYSFCTATLFHSGILEPKTLRPSYYRFLQAISGDRLTKFNLQPFEVYGMNSAGNTKEVMAKLNIINKSLLPKFALTDVKYFG